MGSRLYVIGGKVVVGVAWKKGRIAEEDGFND